MQLWSLKLLRSKEKVGKRIERKGEERGNENVMVVSQVVEARGATSKKQRQSF